ncbi:hypothetical protein G5I_13548 [Acromyrmex echinatior]|uniref:Uncharacterized protein n=1 Tax=Acromyrmex echinatior TaxID=103372 RepID=F4X5C0_ACREC|nr:hypothetical protein G5I_13548 [Acromyrmex echinatior]
MVNVRECEKIVREKTSELIRKKYRALKSDRFEEIMMLHRHFKPIIKPLRQIVGNPDVRAIKRQSRDNDATSAPKRERKKEEEVEEEIVGERFRNDSLTTKVQNRLQTLEDREALQACLDPLRQKYVETVLRKTINRRTVDYVYGVYQHNDGLMFSNDV